MSTIATLEPCGHAGAEATVGNFTPLGSSRANTDPQRQPRARRIQPPQQSMWGELLPGVPMSLKGAQGQSLESWPRGGGREDAGGRGGG